MRLWWVAAFLMTWLSGSRALASERRLLVAFEDSARLLSQQEIRAAIALELKGAAQVEAGGAEAKTPGEQAQRLAVALDSEGLWLKYQGPRGLVERHLPLPKRAEQIPIVVSLAVGNLVREEAFELQRELERQRVERQRARQRSLTTAELAKRRAFAAEPKSPKPSARKRPNALGFFVTSELVYFAGGHNLCTSGSNHPEMKCYDRHAPYRYSPPDGVRPSATTSGSIVVGSARWSFQYGREVVPNLTLSLRAGMALFGGGVMPWFAEYRNLYRGAGWADGAVRPFGYLGFGVMHLEARVPVRVPEYDESPEPSGAPARHRRVEAVAYSDGGFFLSNGFGLSGALSDRWRIEAELGYIASLADWAIAWRSGIGVLYDF